MNLIVVGLNHRTAPVEIRERVAFPEDAQGLVAEKVRSLPGVLESLVLSTCNRVEVYAVMEKGVDGRSRIVKFLSEHHKVPAEELYRHVFCKSNEEAVLHIFRVTSSLDSMVVGEPQILGQVKEAYSQASERKAAGALLHRLLHRAFSVAKQVRTETSIAAHAVSVSYAAVELAKKIFSTLEGKSAALVGAGEMGEIAARHLLSAGVSKLVVTSRSLERAMRLADTLKGVSIPFEELYSSLVDIDIAICSAAAPNYVIVPERITEVMKARKGRPMFFVDISVPRNIDPMINNIDNVYLYNIDDLEAVVAENINERKREAGKAEEIAGREAKEFMGWLDRVDVVPVIRSFKEKVERIRKKELEKAMARWKNITPKEREALDSLTSAIVKKILHRPVTQLKESKEEDMILFVEALKKLFSLDDK